MRFDFNRSHFCCRRPQSRTMTEPGVGQGQCKYLFDQCLYFIGRERGMSQIEGTVVQAQAGIMGFDTTEVLNAVSARNYFNKGYRFCVRYVGRGKGKSNYVDISRAEAQAIVDAGLALMIAQHPLASGWVPTEQMGQDFGNYAALAAGQAGLLPGMNIWLD